MEKGLEKTLEEAKSSNVGEIIAAISSVLFFLVIAGLCCWFMNTKHSEHEGGEAEEERASLLKPDKLSQQNRQNDLWSTYSISKSSGKLFYYNVIF